MQDQIWAKISVNSVKKKFDLPVKGFAAVVKRAFGICTLLSTMTYEMKENFAWISVIEHWSIHLDALLFPCWNIFLLLIRETLNNLAAYYLRISLFFC